MLTPKVSIIVPVYKVERYLDQCVNSLLNQSLEDIEIILVDDDSPDNCPQMCDDYAKKDHRIKVIHKKNQGLGLARNSGLEIATGEYVTFLDSDDWIEKISYEVLYNAAIINKLDWICFSYNRFSDNGLHTAEKYDAELGICDDSELIRRHALSIFDSVGIKDNPIGGSACMALFKRSVIENYHFRFLSEREYISEDFIFSFLFCIHSKKIGWLRNTFYHYRLNLNSLSRTIKLNRMKQAEDYSKFIKKLILENGFSSSDLRYAYGYYIGVSRYSTTAVLTSNMSLLAKRIWFNSEMQSPYLKESYNIYPRQSLSLKQRICFWIMRYRLFWLAYIFIGIFTKVRRNEYR